jgi:hypothetical protein
MSGHLSEINQLSFKISAFGLCQTLFFEIIIHSALFIAANLEFSKTPSV